METLCERKRVRLQEKQSVLKNHFDESKPFNYVLSDEKNYLKRT